MTQQKTIDTFVPIEPGTKVYDVRDGEVGWVFGPPAMARTGLSVVGEDFLALCYPIASPTTGTKWWICALVRAGDPPPSVWAGRALAASVGAAIGAAIGCLGGLLL